MQDKKPASTSYSSVMRGLLEGGKTAGILSFISGASAQELSNVSSNSSAFNSTVAELPFGPVAGPIIGVSGTLILLMISWSIYRSCYPVPAPGVVEPSEIELETQSAASDSASVSDTTDESSRRMTV